MNGPEALRRRERYFRSLIENAHDVITILSLDGTILYQSPSVERVLGYRPHELVGRPGLQLVHPDDLSRARAVIADLIESSSSAVSTEVRFRHKGGAWRVLEVTASNLLDDPCVGGIVINFHDITERVRYQTRRETFLRVAHRFAAEADPSQVLSALLEEALAAVGGEGGAVYRWEEADGDLAVVTSTVPAAVEMVMIRSELGGVGQAIERRTSLVVDDYRHESIAHSAVVDAGLQAGVAVPIWHEGRLFGALGLVSFSKKRFSGEDVELLELIARSAATTLAVLERVRLEGVLLAARTVQHELNNQLALTIASAELLTIDPALPRHLREQVRDVLHGAEAAAATVERLRRIVRLQETAYAAPSGPIIDLARATA